MENDKTKKNQLINYLNNETNVHEPLIHRKETAAWAFIIFYVAIIWTLYNAFFKNNTFLENNIPDNQFLIFSFIVVVLLGFVAFRFVHSQYASIYWRMAYTRAIRRMILDLAKKDSIETKLYFPWEERKYMPKILTEQLQSNLKEIQPFWGIRHPTQILLRFWLSFLFWLYWFIAKKLKKKGKMVELSNPTKQEASLYSIIILVTLAYSYLVLRSLEVLAIILSIFFIVIMIDLLLKIKNSKKKAHNKKGN